MKLVGSLSFVSQNIPMDVLQKMGKISYVIYKLLIKINARMEPGKPAHLVASPPFYQSSSLFLLSPTFLQQYTSILIIRQNNNTVLPLIDKFSFILQLILVYPVSVIVPFLLLSYCLEVTRSHYNLFLGTVAITCMRIGLFSVIQQQMMYRSRFSLIPHACCIHLLQQFHTLIMICTINLLQLQLAIYIFFFQHISYFIYLLLMVILRITFLMCIALYFFLSG